MADIKGTLVDLGFPLFDLPDTRYPGECNAEFSEFFFDLPNRAIYSSFTGTSTGGTNLVTYYQLRVRDSGIKRPVVYRIWISTSPNAEVPSPPPVGQWVDRTILSKWISI